MFGTCNIFTLGLYLTTFLYGTHSFVLLTANVEDLKRIAQKFVSDSLADKIARFIIEASDNNIEIDNSNVTKNLSEDNDEFDVEKKDIKPDSIGDFRQKLEPKQKHKEFKPVLGIKTKPETKEVQKDNKKTYKKKKQPKSKGKKVNKITKEQSSLEYYRSDKQSNKINPNSIIDLEKIHESEDSSAANVKVSRKDFKNSDYFEKSDETPLKTDKTKSNIHKYLQNDISEATETKKDNSENVSEDSNYSNRLDTKSEEVSTIKTNLTTEIERNEFDQYFNTNYPKSDVVATSGPVELTKSTIKASSDMDY